MRAGARTWESAGLVNFGAGCLSALWRVCEVRPVGRHEGHPATLDRACIGGKDKAAHRGRRAAQSRTGQPLQTRCDCVCFSWAAPFSIARLDHRVLSSPVNR
jgi:hypothetical protein